MSDGLLSLCHYRIDQVIYSQSTRESDGMDGNVREESGPHPKTARPRSRPESKLAPAEPQTQDNEEISRPEEKRS